jgi:hypothetical protein
MIQYKTDMYVEELLMYREFDREAKPAPMIPFVQTYTVDQVTEWVKEHGISDEKPLELAIFNGMALLTDGNHRIVAAYRLKLKQVPVLVTYYDTIEELEKVYYKHTIDRFVPIA